MNLVCVIGPENGEILPARWRHKLTLIKHHIAALIPMSWWKTYEAIPLKMGEKYTLKSLSRSEGAHSPSVMTV